MLCTGERTTAGSRRSAPLVPGGFVGRADAGGRRLVNPADTGGLPAAFPQGAPRQIPAQRLAGSAPHRGLASRSQAAFLTRHSSPRSLASSTGNQGEEAAAGNGRGLKKHEKPEPPLSGGSGRNFGIRGRVTSAVRAGVRRHSRHGRRRGRHRRRKTAPRAGGLR